MQQIRVKNCIMALYFKVASLKTNWQHYVCMFKMTGYSKDPTPILKMLKRHTDVTLDDWTVITEITKCRCVCFFFFFFFSFNGQKIAPFEGKCGTFKFW